eukprot:gnl/Hemi2/19978_TR6630_c0_g1_i1.p1 gnl/Hemi2/19978_TR6630_c0_g1~~gnl/Hemi2/19978_TR6630_c0_g1_i1.p1  ORF type:complete len:353 (+),score=71.23 gnl/Hemi2/19978_TR6630_c0_g1_i1:104-1162(+)
MSSPVTFATLSNFLLHNPRAVSQQSGGLHSLLEQFVIGNRDPATSPHFVSREPDALAPLLALVTDPLVQDHDALFLLSLQALKIISRKGDNRRKMTAHVGVLAGILKTFAARPPVCSEAASVLLNLCYERDNVCAVLNAGVAESLASILGGPPSPPDDELRVNSAGAIQCITFHKEGRKVLRKQNAVSMLVSLISSSCSIRLLEGVLGSLLNMTVDPKCLRVVRMQEGSINSLVLLLDSPHAAICTTAAGILQNLARETASRSQLLAHRHVVPGLLRLLAAEPPIVRMQRNVVGALLNILGPDLGPEDPCNPQRVAFKKNLVADCCLRDSPPRLCQPCRLAVRLLGRRGLCL